MTAEEKKRAAQIKKFDWRNSAAKKYLRKQFRDGVIPIGYSTEEGGPGPKAIWDEHCKNHPSFKGLVYDTTFTNRLRAVKVDAASKKKRAEIDKQNYDNYRELHPVASSNSRGEPRWQGSDAEKYLKQDIDEILKLEDEEEKIKRLVPKALHKTRPEYQEFGLKVFRDHIYQEKRLRKFLHFIKLEDDKPSKNKVLEK